MCPNCLKPEELCICDVVVNIPTQLEILVLQHPQEPDHELGTARLAHMCLPRSTLKIGLSWANLSAALGKKVQPSRWAVLYLGSGLKGPRNGDLPLQFVSKKGEALETPADIEGIVVIDGTWSQAKALWWRNAWLLKLKRAILIPERKSLYRSMRKEPRPECLSTIESIAESLQALGEKPEVAPQLCQAFSNLLAKRRQPKKPPVLPTPLA